MANILLLAVMITILVLFVVGMNGHHHFAMCRAQKSKNLRCHLPENHAGDHFHDDFTGSEYWN